MQRTGPSVRRVGDGVGAWRVKLRGLDESYRRECVHRRERWLEAVLGDVVLGEPGIIVGSGIRDRIACC